MDIEKLTNEYLVLFEEKRDWKGAIQILNQLIDDFHVKNSVSLFTDRGICYFNLRQWEEAIQDLNAAIALYPDHHQAYRMKIFIFRDIGNYNAAFEELEKLKKLNYVPAWAIYEYLLTKITMGYSEQVITECKKLLRKTPNDSFVYLARAEAHLAMDNRQAAVKDFAKSWELNKYESFTLIKCAWSRRMIGDYTGALKDYDTLISQRYRPVKAREEKAELLFKMERFEEAIEVYTQLNRISKKPFNYYARGICKILKGDSEAGKRDIRTAIKQDPTNKQYQDVLHEIKSLHYRYLIGIQMAHLGCLSHLLDKK